MPAARAPWVLASLSLLFPLLACEPAGDESALAAAVSRKPDRCVDVVRLDLSAREVTIAGDTSALPARAASCGLGAPAYFVFTVGTPTVLYADTFGSEISATLGLLGAVCGDVPVACAPVGACGTSQAQLVRELAPGTYHLAVAGTGERERGPFVLHVEALSVPNASAGEIPAGDFLLTGTLASYAGGWLGDCGRGPYAWGWYAACPGAAGTFSAWTDAATTFDAALSFVDVHRAEEACCDDLGTGEDPHGARVDVLDGPEAGLHVLKIGLVNVMRVPPAASYAVAGHRP